MTLSYIVKYFIVAYGIYFYSFTADLIIQLLLVS